MIGKLEAVVLDATDIAHLSAFYQGLAGWVQSDTSDDWITLDTPDGWQIDLQSAPDHQPPRWPGQDRPQQAHPHLRGPDLGPRLARTGAARRTLLRGHESLVTAG